MLPIPILAWHLYHHPSISRIIFSISRSSIYHLSLIFSLSSIIFFTSSISIFHSSCHLLDSPIRLVYLLLLLPSASASLLSSSLSFRHFISFTHTTHTRIIISCHLALGIGKLLPFSSLTSYLPLNLYTLMCTSYLRHNIKALHLRRETFAQPNTHVYPYLIPFISDLVRLQLFFAGTQRIYFRPPCKVAVLTVALLVSLHTKWLLE